MPSGVRALDRPQVSRNKNRCLMTGCCHPVRAFPLEVPVARNELRPIVTLRSTADTGYTYVTRKNRRNDADRLTLRKYDPLARAHVLFREER
ncbi:ribosomal protein L33 [Streptacidiphilus sp. MAP12-16]